MSNTILNVAEKPSVAKSVADILSNSSYSSINSNSQYNPVYTFNYNFNNERHIMLFTSVTGHIMEYFWPESLSKWQLETCQEMYLSEPNKGVVKDKLGIFNNLKQYGKNSIILILWLDCDREGENIAYEVVECVHKVNPRIKLLRAHYSSLARGDILNAINTLRHPNKIYLMLLILGKE